MNAVKVEVSLVLVASHLDNYPVHAIEAGITDIAVHRTLLVVRQVAG